MTLQEQFVLRMFKLLSVQYRSIDEDHLKAIAETWANDEEINPSWTDQEIIRCYEVLSMYDYLMFEKQ